MWGFVLLTVCAIVKAQDNSWIVETEYGRVRGTFSAEREIWQFQGIPYGGSVSGENRYKAPNPPTPWTNILDANDNSIQCSQRQLGIGVPTGVEDCLVINVYAPESARGEDPLPVMFYIHGGGFVYDYGRFNDGTDPSFIARHDVIVVTFNYRLATLGFLCLGTEVAPGNAGIKDQIAALQWVNRNIEHFGGNPGSVTIYGHSAGSTSAETILLSGKADGLFHRIIMESSSVLLYHTTSYTRLAAAAYLAMLSNFRAADNITLLGEFFETAPVDLLTTAYVHNMCIERSFGDGSEVIGRNLKYVIEDGNYNKVPLLIAYTEVDGLHLAGAYNNFMMNLIENNFESLLPVDLIFNSPEEKITVANSIKSLYFGNDPITSDSVVGYIDYITDAMVTSGMHRSAIHHSNNSDLPVYVMEFSYRGGYNLPSPYPQITAAAHSDILAHVMDLGYSNVETQAQDDIIRNRMLNLWANFIKFGNPTPPNSGLPVQWTPFTYTNQNYLSMGAEMEMRTSPLEERMTVWGDLHDRYYFPPPTFDNSAHIIHSFSLLSAITVTVLTLRHIW